MFGEERISIYEKPLNRDRLILYPSSGNDKDEERRTNAGTMEITE